jgi:hypothetical protein
VSVTPVSSSVLRPERIPAVVDEPDRCGVQELEFLAPPPPGHEEVRLLEHPHDGEVNEFAAQVAYATSVRRPFI